MGVSTETPNCRERLGMSASYPYPQGSGIYAEEGVERLLEPERADNLKEALIDTRNQCAYELTETVSTT